MHSLDWLAALIDGEGTVQLVLSKTVRGDYKGFIVVPKVAFSNNNREIVETAHQQFGGAISVAKTKASSKLHYTLYWLFEDAKSILEQVSPFLVVKREEAKMFLQWFQRTRGVAYTLEDAQLIKSLHEKHLRQRPLQHYEAFVEHILRPKSEHQKRYTDKELLEKMQPEKMYKKSDLCNLWNLSEGAVWRKTVRMSESKQIRIEGDKFGPKRFIRFEPPRNEAMTLIYGGER